MSIDHLPLYRTIAITASRCNTSSHELKPINTPSPLSHLLPRDIVTQRNVEEGTKAPLQRSLRLEDSPSRNSRGRCALDFCRERLKRLSLNVGDTSSFFYVFRKVLLKIPAAKRREKKTLQPLLVSRWKAPEDSRRIKESHGLNQSERCYTTLHNEVSQRMGPVAVGKRPGVLPKT